MPEPEPEEEIDPNEEEEPVEPVVEEPIDPVVAEAEKQAKREEFNINLLKNKVLERRREAFPDLTPE